MSKAEPKPVDLRVTGVSNALKDIRSKGFNNVFFSNEYIREIIGHNDGLKPAQMIALIETLIYRTIGRTVESDLLLASFGIPVDEYKHLTIEARHKKFAPRYREEAPHRQRENGKATQEQKLVYNMDKKAYELIEKMAQAIVNMSDEADAECKRAFEISCLPESHDVGIKQQDSADIFDSKFPVHNDIPMRNPHFTGRKDTITKMR